MLPILSEYLAVQFISGQVAWRDRRRGGFLFKSTIEGVGVTSELTRCRGLSGGLPVTSTILTSLAAKVIDAGHPTGFRTHACAAFKKTGIEQGH